MSAVAIVLFTLDTMFLYERLCVCCLPLLALIARSGEGGGPSPGAPCAGAVGVPRWLYPTRTKSGPIALPVTPLVGGRQGVVRTPCEYALEAVGNSLCTWRPFCLRSKSDPEPPSCTTIDTIREVKTSMSGINLKKFLSLSPSSPTVDDDGLTSFKFDPDPIQDSQQQKNNGALSACESLTE